ncbi:MAG: acetyl-CoA C-acetyltransferase [Thermoplasmatota archaeon]
MHTTEPRRVAIVAANRIPFARQNTAYHELSNQTMLTDTLQGLVDRAGLEGALLGEVVGGAVMKHARDWNLVRESVLGTSLDPHTPAYDVQQACGTGLESAILVANKIALGQIDAGIACGVDTTSDAPVAAGRRLQRTLMDLNAARSGGAKAKAAARLLNPAAWLPDLPRNAEPRTGLSMGQHAQRTADELGITREAMDELAVASHHNLAAAYEAGFFDDLVMPYQGLERDNNLRPDTSIEAAARLKGVFGGGGTITAANASPLTDGASSVLLASEDWAKERGLPVLAYLSGAQTGATDFAGGNEGLLMAPAYHAVPQLLERHGLALQDFDLFEVHEAFASVVLATLQVWEQKGLGAVPHEKLNVKGSSIAAGHPFAATGTRILATLAKSLAEKGSGRGLISVCAAGGQGVTAIVER